MRQLTNRETEQLFHALERNVLPPDCTAGCDRAGDDCPLCEGRRMLVALREHILPSSAMPGLIDLLETASHSDRFGNPYSHRRLEVLETARLVLRDAAQSLFDRLTSDDIESIGELSLGELVCFQMAIMHLLDANLKIAGDLHRMRDTAKAAN